MASNQIEPPKIDQYQTLRDLLIGSGLYHSRMVADIKDQEVKRCALEYLLDLKKSMKEALPSRFTEAGKDRELTPEVERRMINLYNLNFGRFYLLQFCENCEDLEAVTPHIRKWLYKDFVDRGNDPDHVKRLSEFLAKLDESPEARARYIEQFTPLPGNKKIAFSLLMGRKKYLDELIDVVEDTPEARVEAKRKQGTSAGLTNMKRNPPPPVITEGRGSLLQSEVLFQPGAGLFDLIYYGDFRKPVSRDIVADTATFRINGNTMKIENYSNFIGGNKSLHGLPVTELKLLDVATAALINQNCYGAKNPDCTVNLSLTELARSQKKYHEPQIMDNPKDQAEENRKAAKSLSHFREQIEKDISQLRKIVLSGKVYLRSSNGKSRKRSAITIGVLAPSSIVDEVGGDTIQLTFDQKAAVYLCSNYHSAYLMRLQALDNRSGAYRVAKKILEHYSMKSNYLKGENNSVSVESYVNTLPEFPSFETVSQWKKPATWKAKIRERLENYLNDCVEGGIIERWEYHKKGKNGDLVTPEELETISMNDYRNLIVDVVVPEFPEILEKQREWDLEALEQEKKRLTASGAKKPNPKEPKQKPEQG